VLHILRVDLTDGLIERCQVSNAVACIKIACDFVSMENLQRTRQVASELRQQRLCTGTGQDVLQLFTTLYYAFVALRTTHPSSPAKAHSIPGHDADCSPPLPAISSHALDGDSITSHPHVGSTAGADFSSFATGDLAPTSSLPHSGGTAIPDPKTLHKQNKRRERRRAKLTEAPSYQQEDFGFGCPLCPRRFIRSGVINHL